MRYFVHTCGHPSDCRGSPSMMDRDPDGGPKVGSDMQWLHNVDPAGRGPVPSLSPSSSWDGLAVGCTSLECCLTAPQRIAKELGRCVAHRLRRHWNLGCDSTCLRRLAGHKKVSQEHASKSIASSSIVCRHGLEVWMNGLSCAAQRFQATRKL